MLSLTHNISTRWTTALVVGEYIYHPKTPGPLRPPDGLKHISDTHFDRFRRSLVEAAPFWNQPILLPTILVNDHLWKTQHFCAGSLTEKVMKIEDQLGVTNVGRRQRELLPHQHSANDDVLTNKRWHGDLVERPKAMELTTRINTNLNKVLFSQRSPAWNSEASSFLLSILKEMTESDSDLVTGTIEILELLEHNIRIANSLENHVAGLYSRLEVQLNVVCRTDITDTASAHNDSCIRS
jgi:hypothetical protein